MSFGLTSTIIINNNYKQSQAFCSNDSQNKSEWVNCRALSWTTSIYITEKLAPSWLVNHYRVGISSTHLRSISNLWPDLGRDMTPWCKADLLHVNNIFFSLSMIQQSATRTNFYPLKHNIMVQKWAIIRPEQGHYNMLTEISHFKILIMFWVFQNYNFSPPKLKLLIWKGTNFTGTLLLPHLCVCSLSHQYKIILSWRVHYVLFAGYKQA